MVVINNLNYLQTFWSHLLHPVYLWRHIICRNLTTKSWRKEKKQPTKQRKKPHNVIILHSNWEKQFLQNFMQLFCKLALLSRIPTSENTHLSKLSWDLSLEGMHFFLVEELHGKFLLQQNWLTRFLPVSAAGSHCYPAGCKALLQTVFQAHPQAADLGQLNLLSYSLHRLSWLQWAFYSFPHLHYKLSLKGLVEKVHFKALM